MHDRSQERIAANESIFREINEGIERGQWPGEEGSPVGFRCECARLGCNDLVELSVGEYERIRAHGKRFLVAVGHELPETEIVVGSQPGYLVVEKRGQAGALAERRSPRQ
jgi:hypothetical protein